MYTHRIIGLTLLGSYWSNLNLLMDCGNFIIRAQKSHLV